MNVAFQDKRLAAIETTESASTKLPTEVIKAARRKLTVIRAAPDERTLRNWKSLNYKKLSGEMEGQRSLRLNGTWRMYLRLDETGGPPPTALILDIRDDH